MIIYISGPYTLGDPVMNVRAACEYANKLLKIGHTPIIPHLTMLWHMMTPKPWEEWIGYDLALISAAREVHRLPGKSKGADMECAHAEALGKTVVYL